MTYFGMTPAYISALATANTTFALIFTGEAIIKIIAYGSVYFRDPWSRYV